MSDDSATFRSAKAPRGVDLSQITFEDKGAIVVKFADKTVTFTDADDALHFAHTLTLFLGEPIAGRIRVNDDMYSYDIIFRGANVGTD